MPHCKTIESFTIETVKEKTCVQEHHGASKALLNFGPQEESSWDHTDDGIAGGQINDEASERVLQVEQEFNEKRRPIFMQRNMYIREIPDFWLNVFLQHNVLADIMTTEDSQVLSYLVAVRQLSVFFSHNLAKLLIFLIKKSSEARMRFSVQPGVIFLAML